MLIRFPRDEAGKQRKLSCPCDKTNLSAVKVYFPWEEPVRVHQMRVKPCPDGFLTGYYWYGNKRKSPACPSHWVENVLPTSQTPSLMLK